ncbi:unnamed protein product [Closterium sp. NIES-54]
MTGTDSRAANGEMARGREAGEQRGVAGGGVGTHQPANPTLPTSTTPSPTTVDRVKVFSIEKFMGEDYEHWSFRMKLMYIQYKLLDLVEGKEKMSDAAELKRVWKKCLEEASGCALTDTCYRHRATRADLLDEIQPEPISTVTSATGAKAKVMGMGCAKFMEADVELEGLKNVLWVPDLCANLICTGRLGDAGVNTEKIGSERYRAYNDECLIWDLQRKGDVHKRMGQILIFP